MPPSAPSGHWISTRKTGSSRRGCGGQDGGEETRRAVGMIWPPPRWMASACSTTSCMSMRTSRSVSSQSGPSLHTHCQPATTESLISFRYCTPTCHVDDKVRAGGVRGRSTRSSASPTCPSRTSPPSARVCAPWRPARGDLAVLDGVGEGRLPSSSVAGGALTYRRLCLFGDLDMHRARRLVGRSRGTRRRGRR